jgi:hypothetical protein
MKDYELLDDQGRATPVSTFLAAHRGYRRDAARFPVGLRALADEGLPAEGLDALRNHWRGFDQALLTHHEMEDNFLFPLYRATQPSLASVLDELEAQHTDMDKRIEELNGWMAKLPEAGAVDQTVSAFEAFDAAVSQHLDLEERYIVPLMQADPPQPPQPGGPGGGPPGPLEDLDFAFLGPWLADGLDDDTVAALLEVAPPPFKINFDENRRHYTQQLTRWLP